jgi:hypothetical protein
VVEAVAAYASEDDWRREIGPRDKKPTGMDAAERQRLHRCTRQEHGDVIDLDTTLDQQLLHVPIREVEPQIPADRDHDHLRREPEPGERRPRRQPRSRTGR